MTIEILERVRKGQRVTKGDIDGAMRELVDAVQVRKGLTRYEAQRELTAAEPQTKGWATQTERAAYEQLYGAYITAPPDSAGPVVKSAEQVARERSAGFAAEGAFEARVQKLLRVKKWLSYSAAFTEVCREPEGAALYQALCDPTAWETQPTDYVQRIAKASQQGALDLRRGLGR